MIKLAINGASGRVGRRLIALGKADSKFELVSATCSPGSHHMHTDAGELAGIGPIGLVLSSAIGNHPNVVIDFSNHSGARAALEYCSFNRIPLVVATTGLDESLQADLKRAGETIPVCAAPNMSQAVNLAMKLSQIAARALKDYSGGVDVEIIERHHRFKADSPSGTALKFGQLIAAEMGQATHRHGREGVVGQRPQNEIGYHAVRAGDDPGQHTILFGMLGETIELRVAASNRDCYAHGALAAAKFLVGQRPGNYSMADVLGLG
jgi:4-hydroxy-tetrahydrodipicolinate reductase